MLLATCTSELIQVKQLWPAAPCSSNNGQRLAVALGRGFCGSKALVTRLRECVTERRAGSHSLLGRTALRALTHGH